MRRSIITVALLLVAGGILGCNPRDMPGFKQARDRIEQESTRQTEEAIKQSPALQELDQMCRQIPLPADFRFVWKGGLDDKRLSLSTMYSAESTEYAEARAMWDLYFEGKGWRLVGRESGPYGETHYKNSDYEVFITSGGMGDGVNYSIHCMKL